MQETPSYRRLAENEVVFRQFNEKIQDGYNKTNKLALEDGQEEFIVQHSQDDSPLQFMCECADEKCTMRIVINVYEYKKIHKRRKRFIVLPGHEVDFIEKVVARKPKYIVVEKWIHTPETANKLYPTTLHKARI
jgi:hypothetical protein